MTSGAAKVWVFKQVVLSMIYFNSIITHWDYYNKTTGNMVNSSNVRELIIVSQYTMSCEMVLLSGAFFGRIGSSAPSSTLFSFLVSAQVVSPDRTCTLWLSQQIVMRCSEIMCFFYLFIFFFNQILPYIYYGKLAKGNSVISVKA